MWVFKRKATNMELKGRTMLRWFPGVELELADIIDS